ncbi:MAG: hypothetical protein ACRD1R_01175 [Acidobacteriota bacterium]
MIIAVLVAFSSLHRFSFAFLHHHSHTLAGLAILLCGISILFLGL